MDTSELMETCPICDKLMRLSEAIKVKRKYVCWHCAEVTALMVKREQEKQEEGYDRAARRSE
jgi:hypothetical protein